MRRWHSLGQTGPLSLRRAALPRRLRSRISRRSSGRGHRFGRPVLESMSFGEPMAECGRSRSYRDRLRDIGVHVEQGTEIRLHLSIEAYE